MNKISLIKTPDKPTPGYPPMESALIAPPAVEIDPAWTVPSARQCIDWWDDYQMLDNIKAHSMLVAKVAVKLSELRP
ncbi:hypothetical protein [Maridesulfovibrio sp.]|uniref:hypothetical protein n=1 Tax=Maridesulfovibrio sp. TaxID=2795000 RepID=UPI003B00ACBC